MLHISTYIHTECFWGSHQFIESCRKCVIIPVFSLRFSAAQVKRLWIKSHQVWIAVKGQIIWRTNCIALVWATAKRNETARHIKKRQHTKIMKCIREFWAIQKLFKQFERYDSMGEWETEFGVGESDTFISIATFQLFTRERYLTL